MMTELARKTSLKNKQFRNCDYYAIIPSCSHFTLLTKNPATVFSERCQSKYTEQKINGCMLKCLSKR